MRKIFFTALFFVFLKFGFSQTWELVGPKGRLIDNEQNERHSSGYGSRIRVVYDNKKNPIIYVKTGLGIVKTLDEGDNFTLVNSLDSKNPLPVYDPRSKNDFIVDPSNQNVIYYSTAYQKFDKNKLNGEILIYKTTDGGKNWFNFSKGIVNAKFLSNFLFSIDSTVLYAATGNGVYYLHKDSTTWHLMPYPLNEGAFLKLMYKPGSTKKKYEFYASGYEIYKSSDMKKFKNITQNKLINPDKYENRIMDILVKSNNEVFARVIFIKKASNENKNCEAKYELNCECTENPASSMDKVVLYHYTGKVWEQRNDVQFIFSTIGRPVIEYCSDLIISPANENYLFTCTEFFLRYTISTSPYISSIHDVYANPNCASTHGDIRAISYNNYNDHIYTVTDGTFSVYKVNTTATSNCDKWIFKRNKGLPSSVIHNSNSSPFVKDELVYSLWDQYYSIVNQKETKAFATYQNGETSSPFQYISESVFFSADIIASASTSDDNGFPGFTKCFETTQNGSIKHKSTINSIRQVKRFTNMASGEFYYLNDNRKEKKEGIYLVKDFNKCEENFNETLISNPIIRDLLDEHNDGVFNRFEIASSKHSTMYLALKKTIKNEWLNYKFENRFYKTVDNGKTWINLSSNLPHKNVDYYGSTYFNGSACFALNDALPSVIKNIICDPFDENSIYLIYEKLNNGLFGCVYHSKDGGFTWNLIIHQYADLDSIPSKNTVYPYVFYPLINNFMKGLEYNKSNGVVKCSIADFKINPATGDPIISTNLGVFYKPNGVYSSSDWKIYGNGAMPKNCYSLDINSNFNTIYVATIAGVFKAPLLTQKE